jgi:hypothetical protein
MIVLSAGKTKILENQSCITCTTYNKTNKTDQNVSGLHFPKIDLYDSVMALSEKTVLLVHEDHLVHSIDSK